MSSSARVNRLHVAEADAEADAAAAAAAVGAVAAYAVEDCWLLQN